MLSYCHDFVSERVTSFDEKVKEHMQQTKSFPLCDGANWFCVANIHSVNRQINIRVATKAVHTFYILHNLKINYLSSEIVLNDVNSTPHGEVDNFIYTQLNVLLNYNPYSLMKYLHYKSILIYKETILKM